MLITSSRAENLPVGELSKRSGVNIETIRCYERVKMLVPPLHTASGRRVYDSTALRILVFIRRSQSWDFRSMKCAPCFDSGVPKKLRVARSATYLRIISMTFGRSSAT